MALWILFCHPYNRRFPWKSLALIWPFAACVLIILIHAYFGIHILERGIIFVDLSLAKFVGVGIALSFLFGHEGTERYIFSVAFAVLGAFILAFSRRIARYTNIEAFIGVLYIFSFASIYIRPVASRP